VVVYYHGGGWVIADLETYDASARALAREASAIVVSSHYRQAPEHKFPAAHQDAFAAYEWVVRNGAQINGDPRRVAVAGESAGGNLAANVAIMARDRKIRRRCTRSWSTPWPART
jgi:acetyl esterase/lipase